jgi:hypothetical protein
MPFKNIAGYDVSGSQEVENMSYKKEELALTLTKSGVPCLWEQGGGMSNTGSACIVTGLNGEPVTPVYIRRKGTLACDRHALIPVRVGSFMVYATHHRGDFDIQVYRISKISGDTATADIVLEFTEGEWSDVPKGYDADLIIAVSDATEAAKNKATCYHCREPHYIIQPSA